VLPFTDPHDEWEDGMKRGLEARCGSIECIHTTVMHQALWHGSLIAFSLGCQGRVSGDFLY